MYPHYMERKNKLEYHSGSIIGQLYDEVTLGHALARPRQSHGADASGGGFKARAALLVGALGQGLDAKPEAALAGGC